MSYSFSLHGLSNSINLSKNEEIQKFTTFSKNSVKSVRP